MPYLPHTPKDVEAMLEVIGQPSVEALFESIPQALRLGRDLDLPPAKSEQEIVQQMRRLAARNAHLGSHAYFLGAGTYPHFSPSAVDALVSRSEFYTSYTPYQPEISQGTLQAIFEWQSMVCQLTGLEATNASLYDGASAAAEAALMALRIKKGRTKILTVGLHPHYQEVIETYLGGIGASVESVAYGETGRVADLDQHIDESIACILVQQPNFLGCIEDFEALQSSAKRCEALVVGVVTEALSMAMLRPLGEMGADIVCGEAQSFGIPMGFGGPHLGFLSTRSGFLRQMPGRLVGETIDRLGKRGYVLTLSTREQHIRREKATSNICSNQGLCLMMATIYLALMGRQGLRKLAHQNYAKAEYAKTRIRETKGLGLPFSAPTFNEFVIQVPDSAQKALARAESQGLIGGLDLSPYQKHCALPAEPMVLSCFTELVSREQIDQLLSALVGENP